MKKAALHNLGCKVNAYETEAMQQLLEEAGYEIVPFSEPADVYVVNTCTVTSMADKKSRQMLHRARSLSPDAIVVAAGCYVETGRTKLEKDPEVDLVLGNDQKGSLVARIAQLERERSAQAIESADQSEKCAGEISKAPGLSERVENRIGEISPEPGAVERPENRTGGINVEPGVVEREENRTGGINVEPGVVEREENRTGGINVEFGVVERPENRTGGINVEPGLAGSESLFLTRTKEHTRAFLKVQDGCNRFCSYCIIPYARGRVKSRRTESVIREVEALAANGCREVVLTGIHLSSYGTDTGESLLQLIGRIHEIEGIRRIRLGSLEPGIVTEEFASKLSEFPGLCPHFHLSLQSGCDATLRRMNRGYTAEEYERGCDLLRKYFDHPAITTDVIVGFPGETEEEFAETERFLRRIRFYEMHVFKYSRREGTRAAVMPGQIPETVKSLRSAALIAAGEEMAREYRSFWAGKEREVLFEERQQLGVETLGGVKLGRETPGGETLGGVKFGGETLGGVKLGRETRGGEMLSVETLGGVKLGRGTRGGETFGGETLSVETLGEVKLGRETRGGETLGGVKFGGETLGGVKLGGETLGRETRGGETHGDETFYVGYTKEYVKVACRSAEPLENCIRMGIVGGELCDGVCAFEKI